VIDPFKLRFLDQFGDPEGRSQVACRQGGQRRAIDNRVIATACYFLTAATDNRRQKRMGALKKRSENGMGLVVFFRLDTNLRKMRASDPSKLTT